jgi:hypothetical protein
MAEATLDAKLVPQWAGSDQLASEASSADLLAELPL